MIHFEIKGAKELEDALRKLPQEIMGKVLREALEDAGFPMLMQAQQRAPRSTNPGKHGHMADSIKFRARTETDLFDTTVELALGPDRNHFYGSFGEFGTKHETPRPFMRPAFDTEAEPTIARFGRLLGNAIDRAAKKLARAAKKR